MTTLAILLGASAGLLQGGPLAVLGDGGAAVALPAALAAGWAAVRGAREATAVVFASAVVLGAVSEARTGLYAIALLPAAAAGTLAMAHAPGRRTRAARAGLAGFLGALAYLLAMGLAAGRLPGGAGLWWGFTTSAAVAAATCAVTFPFRSPDRRLFA